MRTRIGVVAVAALVARSVGAATFAVDSFTDAVDASPGDGACETAAGACTLRAAVQEGSALAGDDEILLPPGGYGLTLLPEAGGGELVAAGDRLTIRGAGSPATQIFQTRTERVIYSTATALEIRDAWIYGGRSSGSGGGILASELVLDGVELSNNEAVDWGGGIAVGGGSITDTLVRSNRAGQGGGGIYGGNFTLTRSTVVQNESPVGSGGGLHFVHQPNAIVESTIGDNVAYDGAGIVNRSAGGVKLIRSTVRNNVANRNGGGIFNYWTLELENSTVSGNGAGEHLGTAGYGGGIYNSAQYGADGVVRMRSTTFAENYVTGAGGGMGANVYSNDGSVTFGHTIFVGPIDDADCAGTGAFVSEGYNIEGGGDTCALDGPGDQPDTAPYLAGLAISPGEPTATHRPLLLVSPAIDGGNPAGCPDLAGDPLGFDQRGVSRPRDGDGDRIAVCDVGAVEVPEAARSAQAFTVLAALAVLAMRPR